MPTSNEPQELSELPLTPRVVPRCRRCGAELRPGTDKCWLCFAPVPLSDQYKSAGAVPLTPLHTEPVVSASGFSLASLLMFVTLLSVVLGISTFAPGVGIPLGVALLIVWLRTAARAKHRRQFGVSVTWSETIQLFLASFGVVAAMIGLVCAAGCAAFFAACFLCAASFGERQIASWALLASIGGGVAVPLLWFAIRLIRERWLIE